MGEETKSQAIWGFVILAGLALVSFALSRGCIAKNETCRAAIASGNQAVMNDVCRGL